MKTIRLSRDSRSGAWPKVTLKAGEAYTIVLPGEPVRCVRLRGAHFEFGKTFLLPSAMNGFRALARLTKNYARLKILVNGHTDRRGEARVNRGISEERAVVVRGFLLDDPEVWLPNYSKSYSPVSYHWGTLEDQRMLAAIRDSAGNPYYAGPIDGNEASSREALAAFQASHQIAEGAADQATRKALIAEYMALKGKDAALADTEILTHGCGQTHPLPETGDEPDQPTNRRVEIFLFNDAVAPLPGPCTDPDGCAEYAQWVSETIETIDLDQPMGSLLVSVTDEYNQPLDGAQVHVAGVVSADAVTSGGEASLADLLPGSYNVTVDFEGCGTGNAVVVVPSGGAGLAKVQLAAETVEYDDEADIDAFGAASVPFAAAERETDAPPTQPVAGDKKPDPPAAIRLNTAARLGFRVKNARPSSRVVLRFDVDPETGKSNPAPLELVCDAKGKGGHWFKFLKQGNFKAEARIKGDTAGKKGVLQWDTAVWPLQAALIEPTEAWIDDPVSLHWIAAPARKCILSMQVFPPAKPGGGQPNWATVATGLEVDAKGALLVNWTPKEPGRYLLRLCCDADASLVDGAPLPLPSEPSPLLVGPLVLALDATFSPNRRVEDRGQTLRSEPGSFEDAAHKEWDVKPAPQHHRQGLKELKYSWQIAAWKIAKEKGVTVDLVTTGHSKFAKDDPARRTLLTKLTDEGQGKVTAFDWFAPEGGRGTAIDPWLCTDLRVIVPGAAPEKLPSRTIISFTDDDVSPLIVTAKATSDGLTGTWEIPKAPGAPAYFAVVSTSGQVIASWTCLRKRGGTQKKGTLHAYFDTKEWAGQEVKVDAVWLGSPKLPGKKRAPFTDVDDKAAIGNDGSAYVTIPALPSPAPQKGFRIEPEKSSYNRFEFVCIKLYELPEGDAVYLSHDKKLWWKAVHKPGHWQAVVENGKITGADRHPDFTQVQRRWGAPTEPSWVEFFLPARPPGTSVTIFAKLETGTAKAQCSVTIAEFPHSTYDVHCHSFGMALYGGEFATMQNRWAALLVAYPMLLPQWLAAKALLNSLPYWFELGEDATASHLDHVKHQVQARERTGMGGKSVMVPLAMDIQYFVDSAGYHTIGNDLHLQYKANAALDLSDGYTKQLLEMAKLPGQVPNAEVRPFLAIDPNRPGIAKMFFNGSLLDPLNPSFGKKALLGPGAKFRGLKLYPKLGYPPWCAGLISILKHCAELDIPVMSHSAPGGFPPAGVLPGGLQDYSKPMQWIKVLERAGHSNLHLCLAHYASMPEDWITGMIPLFKYPNVFVDISCATDPGMLEFALDALLDGPL